MLPIRKSHDATFKTSLHNLHEEKIKTGYKYLSKSSNLRCSVAFLALRINLQATANSRSAVKVRRFHALDMGMAGSFGAWRPGDRGETNLQPWRNHIPQNFARSDFVIHNEEVY
jgi:hypothetical protein